MKRILITLFGLISFAYGQNCETFDTVRTNSATMITASSARINGSISHIAPGQIVSLQLKYVRVGQTDTVTSSGLTPLRNITGLQASTQYVYYYKTICPSNSISQAIGPYTFTTLSSTVIYTQMRPTNISYTRIDTMLQFKDGDTTLLRGENLATIRYKSSNNTFYGYYPSCVCWRPLAIDSAGIIGLLNQKVDSVTISGDILYYWINGVSYGYQFPPAGNEITEYINYFDTVSTRTVIDTASAYWAFPAMTRTNSGRLIWCLYKSLVGHALGGTTGYKYSDDLGLTWSAFIPVETDAGDNFRALHVGQMSGDTLLFTTWNEAGDIYWYTSIDDGLTLSAATVIVSAETLSTEGLPVQYGNYWVIPVYKAAPSTPEAGVLYSSNHGATWTFEWIPNSGTYDLSESGLVVKGDSLYIFSRADAVGYTDELFLTVTTEVGVLPDADSVECPIFYAGKPTPLLMYDGRVLLSYRENDGVPSTGGRLAISQDNGRNFEIIYDQTDGLYVYASLVNVGQDYYMSTYAVEDTGVHSYIKQEYYKIPSQGITQYSTQLNNPGTFIDDYDTDLRIAKAVAAVSGANVTLSNLTAPTAVNVGLIPGTTNAVDLGTSLKKWRDGYFAGTLTGVISNWTGQMTVGAPYLHNGNFIARFEGDGAGVPTGGTGVGLEFFRAGGAAYITSFNRTTPAYAPIVIYSTTGTLYGNYTFAGDVAHQFDNTGPATATLYNTISTNLSFAGAATTLTIGGTPTGTITHSYSANATAAAATKTVNIGTGGAASSTTNVNIGDADGGTTTINSPIAAGTVFNAATGYRIGGAAASRKILVGNGTNFVTSTETYAVPGTSGNVLTSDGTNWVSSAPSVTLTYGTYMPTASGETNCTVTVTDLQYSQVGFVVTVSGRVNIDPTLTATATSFNIDLPIAPAENFDSDKRAGGAGWSPDIIGSGLGIKATTGATTVTIAFRSSDITAQDYFFSFTYYVFQG